MDGAISARIDSATKVRIVMSALGRPGKRVRCKGVGMVEGFGNDGAYRYVRTGSSREKGQMQGGGDGGGGGAHD